MLTAVPRRQVLHHHQYPTDGHAVGCRVPTTLKQFKILARLGKSPSMGLYDDIECGTEFYFSEEDYLSAEELSGIVPAPGKKTRRSRAIKCETSPTPAPPSSAGAGPSTLAKTEGVPASKRPRRSVATSVKSYVVPDSDDEGIADGRDDSLQRFAKKRRAESNMQRWIKHLAIMLKDEQKKVRVFHPRGATCHTLLCAGAWIDVLLSDTVVLLSRSTTSGNAGYTLQRRQDPR